MTVAWWDEGNRSEQLNVLRCDRHDKSMKYFNALASRLFLGALFILMLCLNVQAQAVFDKSATEKQITAQQNLIDNLEISLAEEDLSEDQILEIRQSLRDSRSALEDLAEQIKPILENVNAELADLGPQSEPSVEGQEPPPEPENIQKQRAALTQEALVVEGLLTHAEALVSKASRLLESLSTIRRDKFISQLFQVQSSPFSRDLWMNALQTLRVQIDNYGVSEGFDTPSKWVGTAVAVLIFLLLLLLAWVFSLKTLVKALAMPDKSIFSVVAASLILPVLACVVGLLLIYQTLVAQDFLTEANDDLVRRSLWLVAFVVISLIAARRLAKVQIIRSGMYWLALFATSIYALDSLFLESGRAMGSNVELTIAQSYIVTSIFAVLLGFCALSVLLASKKSASYFMPKQIFYGLLVMGLFILTMNIFGYAALSRYLFERIVLLCAIFALVLFIRSFARPHLYKFDQFISEKSRSQEADHTQEKLLYFWLCLGLDLVLILVFLPLVANILGTDWDDIRDVAMQAFFGFEIGSATISIANIGIAILVFVVLLLITRIIQRLLRQKLLPKTKMDEAIRHSITQILGYLGLIIALLAALSSVGFNLTNLALIAGALSVGIGFGLQSIVSNFVSGLILLFERPIKVNDWIITNSGEGIVKNISVRATEIETFDRTSIIVPNSELISSSVKNWTHKDRVGRIVIPVGISYDADPHEALEILEKCIEEHPNALTSPHPNVFFKDFGDSTLLFHVLFFIRNVKDGQRIATEMRLRIWDAFKQANINIAYPQQDLHIRSVEGLEGLMLGK